MLCLFLDSSVILAAAGNSQGGSSKILNFALGGEVILLTSKIAIMEAEKNASYNHRKTTHSVFGWLF